MRTSRTRIIGLTLGLATAASLILPATPALAANVVCAVTPHDAASPNGPLFYGAAGGTGQVTVNRVTSHGADNAFFEATCASLPEGGPVAPFTMTVTYNFEVVQASFPPVFFEWQETGPAWTCEVTSEGNGQGQVARFNVLSADACDHERIYPDNDPSLGNGAWHRLHIQVSTSETTGNVIDGGSVPWPMPIV